MANYTETLREALEEMKKEGIELFPDYSITDETHKTVLENTITNHYLNYEICGEVRNRWVHQFQVRFLELIPEYNYRTGLADEALKISAFELQSLKTETNGTFQETNTQTTQTTGTNDNNGTSSNLFSDKPYTGGSLQTYATQESQRTDDFTNTTEESSDINGENTGTNSNTVTVTGYGVVPYTAWKEWRNAYENTDLWMVKNLRNLFMLIY